MSKVTISFPAIDYSGQGPAEPVFALLDYAGREAVLKVDPSDEVAAERWKNVAVSDAIEWGETRVFLAQAQEVARNEAGRPSTFRRHRGMCSYCLEVRDDLVGDHIEPHSRGGKTIPENIVSACRRCNSKKHDDTLLEMVVKHGPNMNRKAA